MTLESPSRRTIWLDEAGRLKTIDQRLLPHHFKIVELPDCAAVCEAVRNMTVRGAGLIGVVAAYGMWLAAEEHRSCSPAAFDLAVNRAAAALRDTRPTAGNLAWAVERQLAAMHEKTAVRDKVEVALRTAQAVADEDADFCNSIGRHGLRLIRELAACKRKGEPIRILTHCNAGRLAFTDHGSALAPIYAAHEEGVPVYVWVDETRPRNQGAALTAWELAERGVPYALIADNAGGHLMQHGLVDMVITGADRVTRCGDAANKIGTYLKALAARDNDIPFYVALPSSTFDFSMRDGVTEIPIEERDADEVRLLTGPTEDGSPQGGPLVSVRVCAAGTPARNWGFDVTPARLITGLICERGICPATEEGLLALFPEQTTSFSGTSDTVLQTGTAYTSEPTEGMIKFVARHRNLPLMQAVAEACPGLARLAELFTELDATRNRLHAQRLIGLSRQGTAYGNISIRLDGTMFLITGSGTGGLTHLGTEGYALVREAFPQDNSVVSLGPVQPSSEAMTHAAVYEARPDVHCVIHIHHARLFAFLVEHGSATSPDAAYGTPKLAHELGLLAASLPSASGVFAAAGHEDGVFCCADSPSAALEHLLQAVNE